MQSFHRTPYVAGMLPAFLLWLLPALLVPQAVPAAEEGEVSVRCEIYLALDADPLLDDFPVRVGKIRFGSVKLIPPNADDWAAGRGARGFKGRFKEMKAFVERDMRAREVARSVDGVSGVEVVKDNPNRLDESFRMREESLEKTCRSWLDLATDPPGAEVFVDGELKGKTPTKVELGMGERTLALELPGHRTLRSSLQLGPGEVRELREALVRLASLDLDRTDAVDDPAAVLVDGTFVGMTPMTVHLDEGAHSLEVLGKATRPFRATVELPLGAEDVMDLELEAVPREQHCYRFGAGGPLSKGAKRLGGELVGQRLQLKLPTYQVVSSVMGTHLATTHVVDGRSILFEARMGNNFVPLPERLLGRELGGLSFGEVGTEVLELGPGPVTVTEVKRKRSTVILKLRHDTGDEDAVYFDFTRDLKDHTMDDLYDAMCLVFSPQPRG
ncbi:MAG: PEGA domain-containing protein [Acidobacteriota bacterium]